MGVLRNAVKRKTHKERGQPVARRRFGLLEKQKDFRLRAKNFHQKEDHLKLLQRKAEEKNPDEFYFGMENAVTKNGIHTLPTAEANKYTQEELRLMTTQDIKYIALKAQTEAKKVEQLQQRLHLIDAPVHSQHIVFEDPAEESDSADESDKEPGNDLDTANDLRMDPADQNETIVDSMTQARLNRRKAAAYNQLTERTMRHQKLLQMTQEMQLRKELMGKGGSKKIKSDEPGGKPVYKWNLVRKR